MKEFKVAVAQMDIKLGDKETNLNYPPLKWRGFDKRVQLALNS